MSPPSVVAGVTPLESPADDGAIAVSINAELEPDAESPGVGGPSGSGVGLPKVNPTEFPMLLFPKMDDEDEVEVEVVPPKRDVGAVPSALFSAVAELIPKGLEEAPPKIDFDVEPAPSEEIGEPKKNGFGALEEVGAEKGDEVVGFPEGGVEKNDGGVNPVGLKPVDSEDEVEGVDEPNVKLVPFGGTGNVGVDDDGADPNIEVDPAELLGGPVFA